MRYNLVMPKHVHNQIRFMRFTQFAGINECWNWTGSLSPGGYGQFAVYYPALPASKRTKTRAAHRFSYELFVGPIPEGLVIDHLCRNRACVNPTHLEPVTSRVNTHRGVTIATGNAAKTHCPNGHPYEPPHLRISYNKRGQRMRHCQTCRNEQGREYKRRKRDEVNAKERARYWAKKNHAGAPTGVAPPGGTAPAVT